MASDSHRVNKPNGFPITLWSSLNEKKSPCPKTQFNQTASPACSYFGQISGTVRSTYFAPQLFHPKTDQITFVDLAFSCCVPHRWNHLPPQIRNVYANTIFISLLKSHLFELAYGLFLLLFQSTLVKIL